MKQPNSPSSSDTSIDHIEPVEAFPYGPPTEEIKNKYECIFLLNQAVEPKLAKKIFDKVFSFSVLILLRPYFYRCG